MSRLFALALIVAVAGCEGSGRTPFAVGAQTELAPGMSRASVIQIMGQPDGVRSAGAAEVLTYTDRFASGWSWGKGDFSVVLRNGAVTEYGFGQMRDAGPSTSTVLFYPLW